jgi:hypothetical protein
MAAATLSLSSDPVHCTLTRAQCVTVTNDCNEQSVTMANTRRKTGTLALLATVVNAVEARLIATEVPRPFHGARESPCRSHRPVHCPDEIEHHALEETRTL